MKSYILLTTLLITHTICFGQQLYDFQFEPLPAVDTIRSIVIIDQIKEIDSVKKSAFFFAKKYADNVGLFLIEKATDFWVVYDYNAFVSNYSVSMHQYHSHRYVSVSVAAMRSGNGTNQYGWFVLFDLERKTYLTINIFSYNENHNSSGNGDYVIEGVGKCESSVGFKDNSLRVTRLCDITDSFNANYCDFCIASGIYLLDDIGIIKK